MAVAHDEDDPYSRVFPSQRRGAIVPHLRVGIPDVASREFFGDQVQEQSFESNKQSLQSLGAEICEIDFRPFYAVAEKLYEGPWVAERLAVIEDLLNDQPTTVHPVHDR